jgi:hypothetical protein
MYSVAVLSHSHFFELLLYKLFRLVENVTFVEWQSEFSPTSELEPPHLCFCFDWDLIDSGDELVQEFI